MNNIDRNIHNLTSLWREAGALFESHFSNDTHSSVRINNAEWPNKIWTNTPASIQALNNIQSKMRKHNNLTFSHFNKDNIVHETLIENFELKFTQQGMSLKLAHGIESKRILTLIKVENLNDANIWSDTFQSAFKYRLDSQIVLKLMQKANFFLVYEATNLVGCVLLYYTGNTLGINCLGILPKMRKQGYAFDIMCQLINKAFVENIELITLQASDMAKNMYSKLGFTSDFVMENYQLKPNS